MRLRGYRSPASTGLTATLVGGALVLSACATGRAPRVPPPPPPPPPYVTPEAPRTVAPTQRRGEAPLPAPPSKAEKGKRTKGAAVDASCHFCVTNDPSKRQYFDQRRNRYYYFDRTKKAYFWENGEPKA